jgi:hypothetical protein
MDMDKGKVEEDHRIITAVQTRGWRGWGMS